MKILYAVQATGNGHIGRARVMAAAFKTHNISVDWVFSGGTESSFFDMQIFGNYKYYNGLSFVIKNKRLSPLKTLFSADMLRFYQDQKSIDFSQYDLLINDFEPVTAWAAKKHNIKSLSLSHQSAFLYKIPHTKRNILFNLLMKHYAPTQQAVGIHWQQFDKNIIPPIIAQNPNKIQHNKQDIVVYLPFHSTNEIIRLFQNFTEYNFHIFQKNQPQNDFKHLNFHPYSRDNFSRHIATCGGIISNAGFELPSEALQMGKNLLLEPIDGQFEQISNANMLAHFKWAHIHKKITPQHIQNWLENSTAPTIIWPNVADQLTKWLKSNQLDDLPKLSKSLWEQVKL